MKVLAVIGIVVVCIIAAGVYVFIRRKYLERKSNAAKQRIKEEAAELGKRITDNAGRL